MSFSSWKHMIPRSLYIYPHLRPKRLRRKVFACVRKEHDSSKRNRTDSGRGGRESGVSPSRKEYVIVGVKFCISSTPLVSAVNHMASRTFGWKKQQQRKNESFFRLNFNVYINVENKERARASRTKNKGEQFR